MELVVTKSLQGMRAVVIGAGVAGLSAAVSLAARGARVRILEQSSVAGGRLARLKLGEYCFDAGEETITSPQILGQLFLVADQRISDFLELRPVDPMVRLVFPDGQPLDVFRDRERLAAEIERFSPEDATLLRRVWEDWEELSLAAEEHFLASPGSGWRALAAMAGDPGAWSVARAAINPVSLDRFLAWKFKGRGVREMFAWLAERMGASPDKAPAAMRTLAVLELLRGAWTPEGGMMALVEALLRLAKLLGIGLVTDATVERIETANGSVARVTGQGFKPLRADIVVCTADPLTTIQKMLPPSEETKATIGRLKRQEPSRSGLTIFAGTKKKWDVVERLETVFLGASSSEISRQIDGWAVAPGDPPIHVFNASALDAGRAPAGGSALKIFVQQPPLSDRFKWTEAQEASERDRLLEKLSARGLDNIRQEIAEESIVSPASAERGNHLLGGSLYGPSLNTWRGLVLRGENDRPVVGGLHFAGASAHPGPTLALSILSGMLAAERAAANPPTYSGGEE